MELKINSEKISSILKQNIEHYKVKMEIDEVGEVIEAGDGIARIKGLPSCMSAEMLEFPEGNLRGGPQPRRRQYRSHDPGRLYPDRTGRSRFERTGKVLSVPVGDALMGRIVNALGQPIDGKGPIHTDKLRLIEGRAPNVVERQPVKEPLQTGLKCIDSMIPSEGDRRELIIGDRQTGKTAIAIDTILNQKGGDVSVSMWPSGRNSPPWHPWSIPSRNTGPWNIPLWSRQRRATPLPCSTSPPMPDAPWERSSGTTNAMPWSSMTTSGNMPSPTARFHFS